MKQITRTRPRAVKKRPLSGVSIGGDREDPLYDNKPSTSSTQTSFPSFSSSSSRPTASARSSPSSSPPHATPTSAPSLLRRPVQRRRSSLECEQPIYDNRQPIYDNRRACPLRAQLPPNCRHSGAEACSSIRAATTTEEVEAVASATAALRASLRASAELRASLQAALQAAGIAPPVPVDLRRPTMYTLADAAEDADDVDVPLYRPSYAQPEQFYSSAAGAVQQQQKCDGGDDGVSKGRKGRLSPVPLATSVRPISFQSESSW